jgi:hypothetical protein
MIFLPLHFRRRHPADAGAARLLENGDAADIGYVEDRPHQCRARGLRPFHARIDVVDGEVGHPTFRNAIELRTREGKQPADVLIAHLGDPISAVRHGHRLEGPADNRAVEFLVAFGVPRHQLVPVEMSVRPLVWHRLLP